MDVVIHIQLMVYYDNLRINQQEFERLKTNYQHIPTKRMRLYKYTKQQMKWKKKILSIWYWPYYGLSNTYNFDIIIQK